MEFIKKSFKIKREIFFECAPPYTSASEYNSIVRFLNSEIKKGNLKLSFIYSAIKDRYFCKLITCESCCLYEIQEKYKDLVNNCPILAYCLTKVFTDSVVRLAIDEGERRATKNNNKCSDCINYTNSGCKEHIDWYPEEYDFCSKWRQKQ